VAGVLSETQIVAVPAFSEAFRSGTRGGRKAGVGQRRRRVVVHDAVGELRDRAERRIVGILQRDDDVFVPFGEGIVVNIKIDVLHGVSSVEGEYAIGECIVDAIAQGVGYCARAVDKLG
jgi:hypothetical protein